MCCSAALLCSKCLVFFINCVNLQPTAGGTRQERQKEEEEEERLKYSQNEDDDTSSRYQQSPWDDGSQFNLSGVQDRRADGRRRRYTIHKDDRAGKNKSSGEKFKKEEVKLRGV